MLDLTRSFRRQYDSALSYYFTRFTWVETKISLITDNDALQNICDVVKKAGKLSDMDEDGYFQFEFDELDEATDFDVREIVEAEVSDV